MKEVETMSKIAVVYWSGTGNIEAMANEVAEGAKSGRSQSRLRIDISELVLQRQNY